MKSCSAELECLPLPWLRYTTSCEGWEIDCSEAWVGTDLERGYADVQASEGLKHPFSPLSHSSQKSHFKQKSLKVWVHKTLFEKNLEILTSTTSIFAQILALKPPNLKISVHKTPLSEAKISSQAPHFRNLGRTTLPEKKLSALPGL